MSKKRIRESKIDSYVIPVSTVEKMNELKF